MNPVRPPGCGRPSRPEAHQVLALLELPLQLLPGEPAGHLRVPGAFVLFGVGVCHAHGLALLLEHEVPPCDKPNPAGCE